MYPRNSHRFPTNKIYAVSASFDYYVDLVSYSGANLKTRTFSGDTPSTAFRSNPVWMGYYASRPELKYLHYTTARVLMASEIFSAISQNFYDLAGRSESSWNSLGINQTLIDEQWDEYVPSTHHDYVTGTANDYVTFGEQIPLSRTCLENANALVRKPINAVIDANQNPSGDGDVEVYAWNPLGFSRTGIFTVEGKCHDQQEQQRVNRCNKPPLLNIETNSTLGDTQGLSAVSGLHRVQKTHDNGYLAYVDAPALGFKKHTTAQLKTPLPAGSLSVKQVAGMFFLQVMKVLLI